MLSVGSWYQLRPQRLYLFCISGVGVCICSVLGASSALYLFSLCVGNGDCCSTSLPNGDCCNGDCCLCCQRGLASLSALPNGDCSLVRRRRRCLLVRCPTAIAVLLALVLVLASPLCSRLFSRVRCLLVRCPTTTAIAALVHLLVRCPTAIAVLCVS